MHGLNPKGDKDHARKTWTHKDGTFWPADRLPETMPNARILLFSYNSNVVVDVSNVSVTHHATSLLDKLHGCRLEDVSYQLHIYFSVYLSSITNGAVVEPESTTNNTSVPLLRWPCC